PGSGGGAAASASLRAAPHPPPAPFLGGATLPSPPPPGRGVGGGGGCRHLRQPFSMREKIAKHALQVREHIVVPISNNHHAFLGEPARTTVISLLLLFGMLSTVNLNRETEARTIEIKRKWSDRMLPSEMKTVELIA